MNAFLRNNAVFIALSFLLLGCLGALLLFVPKADLHLLLCDHHTPARDIFFRSYTRLAEWVPYVACVLILLFGRVGTAATAAACVAASELTTQLLKHIINAPRPVTWFALYYPDISLPLVEGVRMNHWFSFPSGHTTSFFALAFTLSILITRNLSAKRSFSEAVCQCNGLSGVAGLLQALLFAMAALGGYSRIYLSQHFALDVFAGIIVGLTISTLVYVLFDHYKDQKWYNFCLFKKK